MKRRDFIEETFKYGALVGLFPHEILKERNLIKVYYENELLVAWPIAEFLRQLAVAAAVEVTKYGVKEYKNWRSEKSIKKKIEGSNRMMNPMGYNDFSKAKVHRKGSVMYYPVYNSKPKKTKHHEVCVPFINKSNPSNKVTMLESPGIVGVSSMANLMRQDGDSKQRVANWLIPQKGIQYANGEFSKSFEQPAKYKTKNGIISIDYKRESLDKGLIDIDVRNSYGDRYTRKQLDFTLT